jgi:predicted ATPase
MSTKKPLERRFFRLAILTRAEKRYNNDTLCNVILKMRGPQRRLAPRTAVDMAGMSREMRKLELKWQAGTGWPRRLEWFQMSGLRGWSGQRLDFRFPLMAIVGENGSGKSTILQAAASIYRSEGGTKTTFFPTDFFPDTPWDDIRNAKVIYSVREGPNSIAGSIHKLTERWREAPERRKREVRYIDLGRTVPITSQVGYSKLVKLAKQEKSREPFDDDTLVRFSDVLGRQYVAAAFSLTDVDSKRWVPVLSLKSAQYSGYHQGSGEVVLANLLRKQIPKYSLVLIDELETSLHPRAQRRLIRDLADICRILELQIIVTTHSPYILEELPPEGRVCIINAPEVRQFVTGVSPYFAMSQMDEEPHPEIDLFVEDDESRILLEELIIADKKELARRCFLIPYGAASVGRALGTMVTERRFPRPTAVFLDGDQEPANGCNCLPGGDAPERVVFEALKANKWQDVAKRISRAPSDVIDALESSMTQSNHHDWVKAAADRLFLGTVELWRAMASAWATYCVRPAERTKTVNVIQETLDGLIGRTDILLPYRNEKQAAKDRIEEKAKSIPEPADEPIPKLDEVKELDLFSGQDD